MVGNGNRRHSNFSLRWYTPVTFRCSAIIAIQKGNGEG